MIAHFIHNHNEADQRQFEMNWTVEFKAPFVNNFVLWRVKKNTIKSYFFYSHTIWKVSFIRDAVLEGALLVAYTGFWIIDAVLINAQILFHIS